MSPKQWGGPIWTLFHVLAEKIKENRYPIIYRELFSQIYQICSLLPCNECSGHAKLFLSKIKVENLKTKTDLINMLYVFHNSVNKRTQVSPFNFHRKQFLTNFKKWLMQNISNFNA